MSETEGIKYSKFRVTGVHLDGKGWPVSVDLASYYFRNLSDGKIGDVGLQAALTDSESKELMRVLNDVATRVENELREKLGQTKS